MTGEGHYGQGLRPGAGWDQDHSWAVAAAGAGQLGPCLDVRWAVWKLELPIGGLAAGGDFMLLQVGERWLVTFLVGLREVSRVGG